MHDSALDADAPQRPAALLALSPPAQPDAAAGLAVSPPAVLPEPGGGVIAPVPAALAQAQALARQATSPATLRAYKADWQHYAAWCARSGFVPVPAEPATVGAYLASLAETKAPTTVRRRLAAIGKMHRFNGLPWTPSRRDNPWPMT